MRAMTPLPDRLRLDGPPRKVAVVTGGSRGLGREMARSLALAGAEVCIAARTAAQLEAAAAFLAGECGREPLTVVTDVRESADCERLIAAAVERFGTLDILVNNAGIGDAPGRGKAVWELADGDWLDGIAVNLHGTFWCTRAALGPMRERGAGAILNIASGMGMRATPQSPAYAAAKAGVISLTQSVAAAVARDGVRVNCITPGLVAQSPPATEEEAEAIRQRGRFITARRLGEAWELGPLALFLCSDAAAYVTGANYCIDGGGLAGGIAPTGWAADEVEAASSG